MLPTLLYHVVHETRYAYSVPVSLSRQLLHLTPRATPWQDCRAHRLCIEPAPTWQHARNDAFGNRVNEFAIELPHAFLHVRAESVVALTPRSGGSLRPGSGDWLAASPPWEDVRRQLVYHGAPAQPDVDGFLFASPAVELGRDFADFAGSAFGPGRPLLQSAQALMQRIFDEFEFDPEATTVSTPVREVLQRRRGVCQDFAHLMLSCLRSLGLAARYVSGYLLTQPPPGEARLIGADASHAWVSVFCPQFGWVDFDPTNAMLPSHEHVTLAWGRDFTDVSPLRGVILGGGEQQLEVAVTVTPIDADASREEGTQHAFQ